MIFLKALSGIEASRRAIITTYQAISYGELCEAARELGDGFAGVRLALNSADLIAAVTLLAAAEGRAQVVALTSPLHYPSVIGPLITLIEPDGVLTDRVGALKEAGVCAASDASIHRLIWQIASSGKARAPVVGPTAWIMTTSGTTGMPKLVSHTFSSLTRTTRCDTEKGRRQVWGLLFDYTRFAGLQVMLQSLLSGACLVVPPMDQPLDVQLGFLTQAGCTHLSATPTMWRKILMTPQGAGLPLHQITLGGEIADNAVIGSLARAFPMARISHIFASTEAGVGFSVTDRSAGFPAEYLNDPPSGIKLKIVGGRLWVRNEDVGSAFLGEQGEVARDGWVDTGDMVEKQGTRVYFRGRESGVINVGGNKVHPEEVERALLAHPHVIMARVYAKSNPIMGALVMAEIVPGPDAPDTLLQTLPRFLRDRLERHMIPVSLRLVEDFTVNAAGKIGRQS